MTTSLVTKMMMRPRTLNGWYLLLLIVWFNQFHPCEALVVRNTHLIVTQSSTCSVSTAMRVAWYPESLGKLNESRLYVRETGL